MYPAVEILLGNLLQARRQNLLPMRYTPGARVFSLPSQSAVVLTKMPTLPPGAVAEIEKVVVSAEQLAAEIVKKEGANSA